MVALFPNNAHSRAKLGTRSIIVAGGALILCIWVVTAASILAARQQALGHAETDARNLAAAFADEVNQTLNNVANGMELVAQRMRSSSGQFDIHSWAQKIPLLSDATVQGAIIGPDGRLVSTTLDPAPEPIDLSDRAHFRVHLDGKFRGIFIGTPVTGRVSHQVTIQVTRRVDAPDGTFLGVILFSLAPGQLTSLHKTVELGKHDVILLAGLDNIIRARFTRDRPEGFVGVGQSIAGGPRPDEFEADASGFYVRKGVVDGIERVLGYHRVGKYPLVATVGLDLSEALAPFYRYATVLGGFAGLATLVVIGLGLYLFREIRWRAAREAETIGGLHRAERAEALLRDAVDSISEAFVIYDADDRLVMCNQAYRELYRESAGLLVPGLRFEDLLRDGLAQQRYVDAIGREEEWLAARLERHRNPSEAIEAPLSGGHWALISEQRTRNGGFAGLRVDITQLKQTEAQLRQSMEDLDRIQRIAGIGSTTEELATGEYSWSPGACAIFGINIDDAGKTAEYMRQFYHPADRDKIAEAAEQARLTGAPAPPLEYRIVRPDGALRWVYRENDIQNDTEARSSPPGSRSDERLESAHLAHYCASRRCSAF